MSNSSNGCAGILCNFRRNPFTRHPESKNQLQEISNNIFFDKPYLAYSKAFIGKLEKVVIYLTSA